MGIVGWGAGNVPIERDPIPAGTVALSDLSFAVATQDDLDAAIAAVEAGAVTVVDGGTP
jgi:hypothetical protein